LADPLTDLMLRAAFISKWRLRHKAVVDSLEEAGDALFAFAALPPSQWKSARTTDEMDRHFLASKDDDDGSLLQVRFFVRPRRRPSRSRRAQGRSRLAAFCAATARLGLDWPEHGGMLDRSGIGKTPDALPRPPFYSVTGTEQHMRLSLARAGDLVPKRGASAASTTGRPHSCLAELRRPRA
jgi:hypothetical protein